MRLSRYNFLLIGLFVIAGVLLTWAAWHGSRLSILFMGFYIVALGVLQQLSSALSGSTLDDWKRTLDHWCHESDFSATVTNDYVQVLGLLYDHDPSAAEVFQDRLSVALANRNPEIAVAVAERSAQAAQN